MPLGHRLTWRRKPKGTTACRESGGCPKTCRARPRKTRVTWRKPDCLNLSSQGCKNPSSDTTSWSGAARLGRLEHRRLESPSGGRWPMRSLKGTHEAPTSRSIRRSVRESGIAYGARALWQRSLRSSRRVARVHCCTPAPSEPSMRLSPHSAQASLKGDLDGAAEVDRWFVACRV